MTAWQVVFSVLAAAADVRRKVGERAPTSGCGIARTVQRRSEIRRRPAEDTQGGYSPTLVNYQSVNPSVCDLLWWAMLVHLQFDSKSKKYAYHKLMPKKLTGELANFACCMWREFWLPLQGLLNCLQQTDEFWDCVELTHGWRWIDILLFFAVGSIDLEG